MKHEIKVAIEHQTYAVAVRCWKLRDIDSVKTDVLNRLNKFISGSDIKNASEIIERVFLNISKRNQEYFTVPYENIRGLWRKNSIKAAKKLNKKTTYIITRGTTKQDEIMGLPFQYLKGFILFTVYAYRSSYGGLFPFWCVRVPESRQWLIDRMQRLVDKTEKFIPESDLHFRIVKKERKKSLECC